MKIGLPLKLGVGVVVFFGLLLCGLLVWTPLKIRYYAAKLNSDDPKERVAGVEGLLNIGNNGVKALAGELTGGEEEANLLFYQWNKSHNLLITDINTAFPLHKAARKGFFDAAQLMIYMGVDVNSLDNANNTPLHVALLYDRKSITELLINAGANLEIENSYGWTSLHVAAHFNHKEHVLLLIDRGAKINKLAPQSETPLDMALEEKHNEIANLLRAHGGKTGEELREQENKETRK